MARGRKKKKVVEVVEEIKKEVKKEKSDLKVQQKSVKQDAADHLVSMGYKAEVVNGVVIAYFEAGEGEGFFEKIGSILEKHGYHASYGTRVM